MVPSMYPAPAPARTPAVPEARTEQPLAWRYRLTVGPGRFCPGAAVRLLTLSCVSLRSGRNRSTGSCSDAEIGLSSGVDKSPCAGVALLEKGRVVSLGSRPRMRCCMICIRFVFICCFSLALGGVFRTPDMRKTGYR